MTKEPILSAKDVEIQFSLRGRKLTAIRRCSLDLYEGETLAIVGESGSGKSVFTKSFLGMLDSNGSITHGSIMYDGKDLAKYKKEKDWRTIRGKKISMVMQDPMTSLNPLKKVGKQIQESIELNQGIKGAEAKKLAMEMLTKVGIPDPERRYNQYPHEFSGGQRQRVAMGRAIVRSPKVFLMDEPLSNLDAKLRVQMRVEISKLHQRLETTIIYVTHDQTEAMTLGTRIVVLKDGIIQQVDTPSNLYNTPNNLFVAGFIGSPQMNLIDAEVVQSGSQVTLKMSDTVSITLPAEKSEKLKSYVGKTVVVGIRPEDIKDDEEFVAAHADHTFEAQVKVYELLGAEVNLHYDIAQTTCTAKVNPRTTARPGDTVKFAMDIARLHVFDKETEQVITH